MTPDTSEVEAILFRATIELQEAPPRWTMGEAVRYAVLKRLEDDLDLPVVVKYGDSGEVRRAWSDGSLPWRLVPDGHSVFYVEAERSLTPNERRLLHRTMISVGAWFVGSAGTDLEPSRTHYLYVQPDDHPLLDVAWDYV